jgi:sulfhydrogenase subunit beta (sulfur reductase)
MKNYVTLKKDRLDHFIGLLARKRKVMAPVSKGYDNYAFQQVTSAGEISLDYIPTIIPPKKYFMPQFETFLEYDKKFGENMNAIVDCEDMVLFGVHTCDIEGIKALNIVFTDRPRDYNYLTRKNKIIIIGLECNAYCDDYASCGMMHNYMPDGGYDLFFTDIGDVFMIHVNTHIGDELVADLPVFEDATSEHLKALNALREKKREIFKNEVGLEYQDVPEVLEKTRNSEIWEEIGKKCLSCGNCTNVCPTCYCFNIVDEIELDLKTGKRIRMWDSCQNESYALVAGGENFREERAARQQHRFFKKFKYTVDRYSRFFCTGCGRCSRTCMAKIDLKETFKKLKEESA